MSWFNVALPVSEPGKGLCPQAKTQYKFELGDRCAVLIVAAEDKLCWTLK